MNKIPQRLRELREERGLSQTQLAKALNYTQAAIAHWEGGTRTPNIDCLIAIAKFFDCSLDYLVGLVDY